MKKSIITVLSCSLLISNIFAQKQEYGSDLSGNTEQDKALGETIKKLQKLKVSGYIQTQYQWGEKDASLKVGGANEKPDESFSRMGIRRGRIKFAYEEGIASGVFQLDMTEKGVGIKDAYLNVKDPWTNAFALKAGIFDRTFGNEISYSSSRRESPERSTIFQTLFPEERDLGVALIIQPDKNSALNFLKLEAGLFAGNGIKQETDSRKDFIGHLSANKKLKNIEIGGGVSYYNGGVYQGTNNVYHMRGDVFILNNNSENKGAFAKREYIGFDGQLNLKTTIGITQLRTEYLFGKQPGSAGSSKSPNGSSLPANDTYIRNFNGGYVIFVQELGNLPLCAVLKYDWYDPNTKLSESGIGLNNTAKGDIAYNNFGFGMLWNINTSVRLQAWYDISKNEKAENLAGYKGDRKDNVFTLRMQYKF